MSLFGGGAPQNTTTTVKQTLPAWAKPFAQNLLYTGSNVTSMPYARFPYTYLPPGTSYPYTPNYGAPNYGGNYNKPGGGTGNSDSTFSGGATTSSGIGTYSPYTWNTYGGSKPNNTTGGGQGEGGSFFNIFTGETYPVGSVLPYTSKVSPLTPWHEASLAGITNRALEGSPVMNQASGELLSTLKGEQLNPYYNAVYRDIMGSEPYRNLFSSSIGEYTNPFTNNIFQSMLNSAPGVALQDMAAGTKLDPTQSEFWQAFTKSPAGSYMNSVMAGDYLRPESNPFITSVYNTAADRVKENYQNTILPSLRSSANRAGAFGGSSHALMEGEAQKGLAKNLSDMAASIYGQNYATERGLQDNAANAYANLLNQWGQLGASNQMGAAKYLTDLTNTFYGGERGYEMNNAKALTDIATTLYNNERNKQYQGMIFAPTMAEADYTDLTKLMGVGDVYRGYQQDVMNDIWSTWQEESNWPYLQTQRMAALIPAAVGNQGTTTTTTPNPYTASPLSNIFGGAASGIGMGLMAANAGLNPMAAGAVGLLPLLASIFR